MLDRKDVIGLYNTLLNREPESEDVVENYIKIHEDIFEAMKAILHSEEYKNKILDRVMPSKLIPSKVIIFSHIPKTAGTYLRTGWLLYNVVNYFWTDEKREHPKLLDLEKSKDIASSYGLIGGHKPISELLKVDTIQQRIIVSVLRDPIERIISFYNHVKYNDKTHPFHKKAKESTLYELLSEKKDFYNTVNNEQIKYIVTKDVESSSLKDVDIVIIGMQNKIDLFINKVNQICELKHKDIVKDVAQSNSGKNSYKNDITNELNYNKALEILKEMTKDEYKFIDNFGDLSVLDKKEYIRLCNKYADLI